MIVVLCNDVATWTASRNSRIFNSRNFYYSFSVFLCSETSLFKKDFFVESSTWAEHTFSLFLFPLLPIFGSEASIVCNLNPLRKCCFCAAPQSLRRCTAMVHLRRRFLFLQSFPRHLGRAKNPTLNRAGKVRYLLLSQIFSKALVFSPLFLDVAHLVELFCVDISEAIYRTCLAKIEISQYRSTRI